LEILENMEVKYCKLTFESCYDFYKLVDCLSKFLDECEIDISENSMQIRAMDVSRICLLNIKKHLYSDKIIQNIKVGLDFVSLAKILKCVKNDKKELTVDFDTEQITNYKVKRSTESITKKTLKTLDIVTEDIPIENLMAMEYPNYVEIRKTYLSDFFRESDIKVNIYSEIIEIKIDSEGITFSQDGVKGNSEFLVDKDNLVELEGFDTERGNYSLAYLNNLKTLLSILENTDTIKISLKEDHPLKIEIYLDSLDIQLTMFLAPRVKEVEYYDDDDNLIDINEHTKY